MHLATNYSVVKYRGIGRLCFYISKVFFTRSLWREPPSYFWLSPKVAKNPRPVHFSCQSCRQAQQRSVRLVAYAPQTCTPQLLLVCHISRQESCNGRN